MRNLKRALSLALASVMLLGMMVVGTGASYADVDAQDNLEAIEVLQLIGVMSGDEKGNFNPDKNVTRNEMAVIMTHLLKLNAGGTSPFTDVPSWAQPYVAACYANGTVAGISKTQYGGDANVTAAQAALMVMKALGYFGYQGEFGDDWQLAVVKQAGKIDLFNDINAAVSSPLTRSEVAQLVLNALESTVTVVTQQGGMSVDGNGMSVVVNPTYTYEEAESKSTKDYAGRTGNKTQELVEKLYGTDLKKDGEDHDAFGRPANKWTYKTEEVVAPKAADATYTASVKGKTIYADLGKPSNATIAEYVVDGDDTATITAGFEVASGNSKEIGGNGVLTEVYYDKDEKEATIVLINTYAGEVVDCEKNDDDKYDISLDGESEKFESDIAYDNEDIVLYTKTKTSGGSTDEIKSMALAEKVTGEVTRVKDSDSFVLDGTTYKYNKAFDGTKLTATAVDFDTDVYLDAYGYVVKLDNTSATTNYAVVVGVNGAGWDENDANKEAKLLFPDGTVSVVTVTKVTGGSLVNNSIVTYTKNSDDEYTLVVKDTISRATGELKAEKGKSAVKVNGTTYTATAKTEYFLYNSDDKDYTTYTGFKNASGLASASGYDYAVVTSGTVLKAVYIKSTADVTDNEADTASFIYIKGNEKMIKDSDMGDYYNFKAVVDGKITTVDVSASLVGPGEPFSVPGSVTHTGYIISKMNVNKDGVITSATVKADGALDGDGDGYFVGSMAIVKAEDDVITIRGNGYAYSDDVKVFEYNTDDGKFVTKTITSLKTQTYTNMFVQFDNNAVIAIYYVK